MPKIVDWKDKTVGSWDVLYRCDPPKGKTAKHWWWVCKCRCPKKTKKVFSSTTLREIEKRKPVTEGFCGCERTRHCTQSLQGLSVGNWKVLHQCRPPQGKEGRTYWMCECQCAAKTNHSISTSSLRALAEGKPKGATSHCGCIQKKSRAEDLTGRLIGKWLVLEQAEPTKKYSAKTVCWKCECQCDQKTIRVLRGTDLRKIINYPDGSKGGSSSCGCSRLNNKPTNKKHGHRRLKGKATPTYRSWLGAQQRCINPNSDKWLTYGGHPTNPVTMCERWVHSFDRFLEDMGERPTKHSIDRIDGTKGYWCGRPVCSECGPAGRTPNCRWATAQQQARNKVGAKKYLYKGTFYCIWELAELPQAAVGYQLICSRIGQGWSVEDAVERPKRCWPSTRAASSTESTVRS